MWVRKYAYAFVDADKKPLDGSKNYKLHLPPNIPAKNFWSVVVYDNQTRSELQTDQQFPTVGSEKEGVVTNPDTSADVYFGPTAQPVMKRIGYRPFPAKAGTSSSASTARSSRGTTRLGGQVRSNW